MILVFQRIVANYRNGFFKKLNRDTGALICLGKKGPKNTYLIKSKPDFKHILIKDFYPIGKKETLTLQDVFTPLFKYRPKIIIIEFTLSIITNWFFLILRPFFKYKIILWSHGYNRKKGFNPKKNFSDKLRAYWMNKADAIILYGYKGKKMIEPFTLNREKIFVAPNTLDTNKLLEIRNKLEKTGEENIKKELGLKEKYNLIFLGRLLKEKEPEKLLDILSDKLKSIELHFVGDGPLYSKLLRKSSGLDVRFWGSIADNIFLGKLLFSSDLLVIPGCIGLSVVHSFCFDCPVITQKKSNNGPFHGPEIEYVVDGQTGFTIEKSNNEKMINTILNYLLAPNDVKNQFKKNIREILENRCSIENMVTGFKKAINYCKGK